jgi:hypothetical protein
MEIDCDNLGIPDTEYNAHIAMSSAEFYLLYWPSMVSDWEGMAD